MKHLIKKSSEKVRIEHPCGLKCYAHNRQCEIGDLVWSYQYGVGEVLSKNTATVRIHPLDKKYHDFGLLGCFFILREQYKRANEEVVAYWEIELLPKDIQQVKTEDGYAMIEMLYPDMSDDLKRDLVKYVIKTSSKEKIKKIFKKMLTLKSVLLRCITSRGSKQLKAKTEKGKVM